MIEVARFREKLSDAYIAEVFLPSEIEYCRSQVRYWENFAARYAARKAAFKAIGERLPFQKKFCEVEVVRDKDTGAVTLKLHGETERAAAERGIRKLHLSLSHTGESAVALVVAEGD